MNLTQIGYISIRNNQIVDQVEVQNLLKQKYPAAAIMVQDSLKWVIIQKSYELDLLTLETN